ncbi:MAG TPA: single-stranded DNA-binding protein [Acidimicrobiia bacterium]|nr:single-stranded DNA-binding protein [Acidimicrobiia bacterium]
MNTVQLIGNITADPTAHAGERHETARFRLAVDRPGSDSADFIPVVVFDRLAQVVAEHLSKGRKVAVVGRLRSSEWTTSEGERRFRLEVVGETVKFLDRPNVEAGAA